MYRFSVGVCIALLTGSCAAGVPSDQNIAPGSLVQVVKLSDGAFTLLRNGEPYLVKGTGTGSGQGLGGADLQLLAASGGNSIRTWGIEQLEDIVEGKPLLDRAHELGISVMAGFWVHRSGTPTRT